MKKTRILCSTEGPASGLGKARTLHISLVDRMPDIGNDDRPCHQPIPDCFFDIVPGQMGAYISVVLTTYRDDSCRFGDLIQTSMREFCAVQRPPVVPFAPVWNVARAGNNYGRIDEGV